MTIESGSISLAVGGSEMKAYVSTPSELGVRPGIIVFQEALGVNAQLRGVATGMRNSASLRSRPNYFTGPGRVTKPRR